MSTKDEETQADPNPSLPEEPLNSDVAVVICTYKRPQMLQRCLAAIHDQTYPTKEVIVVDNAGAPETVDIIASAGRPVTLLSMSENVGPAGGFAVGMRHAYEQGHCWILLFNDDARPTTLALQRCIEASNYLKGVPGVIAANALSDGTGEPTLSPWFNMNGALLHRDVISLVGLPREDFFMCFEEDEYCMRMQKARLPIYCLTAFLVEHATAGSTGSSPPWRGYYQTRNELIAAIAHRSAGRLLHWLIRQAKFVAGTVLYLDRRPERLKLRALGAWHAVRGVSGRTIEPDVTGGY